MRKTLPIAILFLVGVVLLFVKRCRSNNASSLTTIEKTDPSQQPNRNRGFDRRTSYLEYTNHARCRMDCRHITQAEVEEIMRNGKINYRKSDVNDKPCPTYALEGMTAENERLRIVFAQCDYKTRVVTVVDLDKSWQCDCPGDDVKYKNN